MKTTCILVLLLCATFVSHAATVNDAINPVIGNRSFVVAFGHLPKTTTNEVLRIRTHLEYVERLLRSKDCSQLPEHLRRNRTFLLDKLREYLLAGKFSRNDGFPNERKPCFIDKRGNICAVGYLVEQSAGRALAERINAHHQYDKIHAMTMPELLVWVEQSGLTLEECAMIQPTYQPNAGTNYTIVSVILGGVNGALSGINTEQIIHNSQSKFPAILGIASGATSVILGGINFYQKEYDWIGDAQNVVRPLSAINIGIGAASMLLGGWNLFFNNDPTHEQTMTWNVYSAPLPNNQLDVRMQLTYKW